MQRKFKARKPSCFNVVSKVSWSKVAVTSSGQWNQVYPLFHRTTQRSPPVKTNTASLALKRQRNVVNNKANHWFPTLASLQVKEVTAELPRPDSRGLCSKHPMAGSPGRSSVAP
jgi:hypothetical protein